MPKVNIYPPPSYGRIVSAGPDNGKVTSSNWDEYGATRRVELGYSSHEIGGGVQIATTVREHGANPDREYVDDPKDPMRKVWDGQFVDLDRGAINQLIRELRNARDKSFGRDE